MAVTIIGIDPGYDRLGWAIGRLNHSWIDLHYGCCQTNAKQSLFSRYQSLISQLQQIIIKHHPEILAIESLFFFKNQKTAFKVSEARGVILGTLLPTIKTVREFTPLQIKQTVTGYGRADKKSIEKMVRMEFKLDTSKIIDDTIDALAILITYKSFCKYDQLSQR